MSSRAKFPRIFWIANSIEILERFAYYGIYAGFGIYMEHLGYSKDQLGVVQSIFLAVSYLMPVFSGTIADRYGFKKMLIVSYLAYIPSILLLIVTQSFSGIALAMLSIAFAAGIFKPLVSGTVRAVTDHTNKTLGFGIFYQMVNFGATFGPLVAGKLRVISWDYAFFMAACSISVMFVITLIFYKEPKREPSSETLGKKLADIWTALSDLKFALLLLLLGLFFWLPFWSFFNLCALYIDSHMDTAWLFLNLKSVLGEWLAQFFAHNDAGVWKINGESIANTGYAIILLQVFVSGIFEKRPALPSFMFGMLVSASGFVVLGTAYFVVPSLVFLGIFLFAVGEMISSPRIQEYITWIAPKEKAGLYMGTNFLATFLGGLLSGLYTSLYGHFEKIQHIDYIWYTLAAHMVVGILAIFAFIKFVGEFKELKA